MLVKNTLGFPILLMVGDPKDEEPEIVMEFGSSEEKEIPVAEYQRVVINKKL